MFERFRPDLWSLADEELMAAVSRREPRAMDVLFRRHGGPAFSLAFRMCGRRGMAEEVVQEAFLALWRHAARYDPGRGSVRSWVLRIVRNRAIDAFRREAAVCGRDIVDEQAASRVPANFRTDAEVERQEDSRRVRAALEGLPTDQRQVIELAYFGGFTHSEIAAMLDLPPGTVKGRMRLGLAKLRVALDDDAGVVP